MAPKTDPTQILYLPITGQVLKPGGIVVTHTPSVDASKASIPVSDLPKSPTTFLEQGFSMRSGASDLEASPVSKMP